MKNVVWDIETNGFLEHLDRVHSLCLKDLDTGEVLSCTDDPRASESSPPISEGLKVLSEAETIYGHNIIRFDIPALQKVYPKWTYSGKVFDTLVVANFRYAHLKSLDFADKAKAEKKGKKFYLPLNMIGRQSLEAWGHRLGVFKGEYKDWCKENGIDEPFAEWRPEMQTYCEQDLEVNEALIRHLRKVGGLSREAVDIEHRLAWYLAQQERNGWPFDLAKAEELHATLAARKQELAVKLVDQYGFWFKSKGEHTPKRTTQYKVSKTNPVPKLVTEGCPYTKIERIDFNPGSRAHIHKILTERYGWKPTEFTPKGNAKMDEDVLLGLDFGEVGADLLEYLMLEKRLGQLANGKEAWLDHATAESEAAKSLGMAMIHHEVMQNRAVTHRAAHKKPNAAQVPAGHNPYGKECRELWVVPEVYDGEEWVLLGCDVSQLELVCLAHYMAKWDGGAYGRAIMEGDKEKGTDVHSLNRDALRSTKLPDKLLKYAPGLATLSRDDAKTFIYAYLYGAGDKKLGSIVAPGAPERALASIGKLLRNTFESKFPALGELQKAVKKKYKNPGYLIMPDGRRTYIRHKHAALNSLLQAAGAIICKGWIEEYSQQLHEAYGARHGGGWDQVYAALGWIHDEVQVAVRKPAVQEVAEIITVSLEAQTERFNWRFPIEGAYSIGMNWAETH